MTTNSKQWLRENATYHTYREDLIDAGATALGKAYATMAEHVLHLERKGEIDRKPSRIGAAAVEPERRKVQPVPRVPKSGMIGLSRNQALLKHDIPAKLEHELNACIDSMEPGMLYEDPQVRKACKVSNKELEYWTETVMPAFAQYHGTTELDEVLWGTEADMEWAEREMTGFRRSIG